MKLGIITSLWAYAKNISVAESLKRIAALGLRHVDILGFLHGRPQELAQVEKETIRERLACLDLTLGSLVMLPPGNIASQDADERRTCLEYIRAGIDFVAYLGGKQVLFNGGKRDFGASHAKSWQNAVSFVRQVSMYAQEKGIYVTIEAEPYIYFLVNDLDTTLQMLKDVNHPHCMCALDLGHMNLSRDAPQTLEKIKPWTLRVHLSENDGLLHSNNILGNGTVDTGAYLRVLQDMDFEQPCKERGMDLVAVMELGVLGEDIPDPEDYALRSIEHILKVAPFIEL